MQHRALVGPGDWATAHSWPGKSCWRLLVLKCKCCFLGQVLLLGWDALNAKGYPSCHVYVVPGAMLGTNLLPCREAIIWGGPAQELSSEGYDPSLGAAC